MRLRFLLGRLQRTGVQIGYVEDPERGDQHELFSRSDKARLIDGAYQTEFLRFSGTVAVRVDNAVAVHGDVTVMDGLERYPVSVAQTPAIQIADPEAGSHATLAGTTLEQAGG